MVKAWMSYLEPELVHRWPWLHSKIALLSARPHAQSKGSGVANDRFSLYPLDCFHPARMKITVQTHPLILLWIRPTAAQEPNSAISQPVTSSQRWNKQQEPNAEKRTIQTKMKILSLFLTSMSFRTHMTFSGTEKVNFRREVPKLLFFHTI